MNTRRRNTLRSARNKYTEYKEETVYDHYKHVPTKELVDVKCELVDGTIKSAISMHYPFVSSDGELSIAFRARGGYTFEKRMTELLIDDMQTDAIYAYINEYKDVLTDQYYDRMSGALQLLNHSAAKPYAVGDICSYLSSNIDNKLVFITGYDANYNRLSHWK